MAILKRVVERIREACPEVGILLRADSHYGNGVVMDYCEGNDVHYILGLGPNPRLSEQARPWTAEAVRQSRPGPVRLFGEFTYRAQAWKRSRRVIVKAEQNALGTNTRFIVTDLESENRAFLYKRAYWGRGEMELFIKDHKTYLHSDRTSCSRFEANQFRLLLTSLAYILVETFRRLNLKGTEWAARSGRETSPATKKETFSLPRTRKSATKAEAGTSLVGSCQFWLRYECL